MHSSDDTDNGTTYQSYTPPSSPSSSQMIVPDILLSMAKDNRYQRSLTFLLSQTIHPFLPLFTATNHNSNVGGQRNSIGTSNNNWTNGSRLISLQIIQPEISLLARIIHAIVIWRENHSIGQEYLNLGYYYYHNANNQRTRKSKLHNQMEENRIDTIMCYRKRIFILLYTVAPYLIQRVGQDGWGDLKHLFVECRARISQLVNRVFLDDDVSLRQGSENRIHNQYMSLQSREGLHGNERIRIYEEMRRQMMERAIEAEAKEERDKRKFKHHDNTTSNNEGVDEDENGSISALTIEQQHHQPESQHRTQNYSSYINTLRRKLGALTWTLLRHIHQATKPSAHCPIAHENSPTQRNNVDNNNVQNNNGTRYYTSQNTGPNEYIVNILKWVVRLNLALFYANSKYPTILNRLIGIQIISTKNINDCNAKIAHNPINNNGNWLLNIDRPSYKPICYLILLQSSTRLIKGVIELILNTRDDIYKLHRSRQQIGENDVHSAFEKCVPSLASLNENAETQMSISQKNNMIQCGICMSGRTNPSAPKGCGHVFCWSCIQHWIARVRPECPLCRAPTRAQDVCVLYHYSPN